MENSKSENKVKKIKKTVLDQFTFLTNNQEKVRLKSSLNILKYLNQNESSEKEIELKYILGRVIRGLGSSTSNARAGFYTILVALLNFENIDLEEIFECVKKHLHTAGSNTKSENADILTGQILANGAIIRSNIWTNLPAQNKTKVITSILTASKERSYQGLLAYDFIIHAIEKINEKDFQVICPILKEIILSPVENYNVNSLYLVFFLKKKYPSLPKNLKIKYPDFFSEENINRICNILTSIPKLSTLEHPVYEVVGSEIASAVNLNVFLESINETLEIPNRIKLLAVIKTLTIIVENIKDSQQLPNILCKNFIHHTLNHFKSLKGQNQDAEFKQSINNFFNKLIECVKGENIDSKTKISILKKLLFSPGTFIFEKITHSKVIQNITWSFNSEEVKTLGKVYKDVIQGTEMIESQYGHGDYWLNNDKLYAAHLLIKLLNHKAMKEENKWKIEQLIFLMELGILKGNDIHIGTELSAAIKTAFFGALDLKHLKLEDLHNILYQIVIFLDSKLNKENLDTILRNSITLEEFSIWEKAIKTINKIENKKEKGGLRSVFLTLFLHLSLLLFNDTKLAMESLNELFECYKHTKNNDIISNSLNKTAMDETCQNLSWIEVVTDLFLNFLSQNSSLLRTIVNIVFPYLCKYMTPNTIHQLLSVLDPDNENPLSKRNESDEESDESSSGEDSHDENEQEDEDGDEDDVEEEDETVNDKLRMALHKVLIDNGYKSDEESIDLDQLSDTEGEKLDKALGKAFKQFKPNRGKSKKQDEENKSLTHFRVRVLDLIEIYLDSNPSMILTLEIMLPLLKSVEFSIRDEHQSPLLNRLKSCLKKLSNLKKFEDKNGVNNEVLNDLLKSLLDKGTKSNWILQDMGEQITDCCIFVIKCADLLLNDGSTPKKVKKHLKNSITDVIINELETYFNKRECVTPILFFKKIQQLSWDGNLKLIPLILKYIFNSDIKIFRKSQAAELATLFYSNQRYLSIKPDEIKETLMETHTEFSEDIINMFKIFCDSTTKNVSEKFLCHIFKLLTAMKSCCLNIDNIKWSEVADVVREYRSMINLSKDAKMAFNKLCDRLNVSNVVKMKPQLKNIKEAEENIKNEEKKKSKKKQNKEVLKLKKEAKELRLQSLSDGLKCMDFTLANDVEMLEEKQESDSNKKRKADEIEDRFHTKSKKNKNEEETHSPIIVSNGTNKSKKTKKK